MNADSIDLRERVVAACDVGGATREQVAARSSVSVPWIRQLSRRRRDTGSIAPKPRGGGRAPACDGEAAGRLREAVRADDDATREARAPRRRGGVPPLRRAPGAGPAGEHAHTKSRRAAEQDRPERKAERDAWRAEFAAVDPARRVFVDESGASTARDRTDGRAPSGVRVDGPVPHGHGKVVTRTAAVRRGGVPESACLACDGATDTAGFEADVGRCLVPAPRPGDIVVLDHLACPKTAAVARRIASAGAAVRYLPAYRPDLNPIERRFSKLKAWLRQAKARTIAGRIEAMGDALRGPAERHPRLVPPERIRGPLIKRYGQ